MSHIEEGRLHAYVDDQLPARERSEVEAHVAECAQCRARLDAAEELVRASHAILGQVDPGPGRPAPWAEIEARGAARSRRPRRGAWLDPRVAWAATIALAFAVGWLARGVPAPTDVGDVSLTQPLVQAMADSIEPLADERTLAAKAEPPGDAEPQPERPATPSEIAKTGTAPSQPGGAERQQEGDAAVQAPAPSAESRELRQRSEVEARRRADEQARRLADEEAHRRADVARPERAAAAPMAQRREADSLTFGAGVALDEITVNALRVEGTTITEGAGFLAIEPSAAATWLGAPLRTLPGFALERAEVGPGAAVRGGVDGLPAVRLVYRDDAGHAVTLLQQRVDVDAGTRDATPALVVPPSGPNALRWTEGGYVLTLTAELGGDSLRALAAWVR